MAKNKNDNFEANIAQLEAIVQEIEKGDLQLDKCLDKFEEGVDLYKKCSEYLNTAEKRVQSLLEALNNKNE